MRNLLGQYRDDIVIDNTDVGYVLVTYLVQEVADARAVYLNGKVIILGMSQGMLQGAITSTDTYIQHQRCPAPE